MVHNALRVDPSLREDIEVLFWQISQETQALPGLCEGLKSEVLNPKQAERDFDHFDVQKKGPSAYSSRLTPDELTASLHS